MHKPEHPLTPYPRGWYLAAYSDELGIRAVKCLRLFGKDTVLFRDEHGVARLVDAYCPHLGAHLGHGGKVVGENLRCPFHGWEFRGETGECVRTGNGDPPPPKARTRSWHVEERSGGIFVWFHEHDEAPSWIVGTFPDYHEEGWSEWNHSEWTLNARIQDISENDADISHSPVMHDFTEQLPSITMEADGPRCEWTLGADIKLAAFGVPKLPPMGPLRYVPERAPSKISVLRWGLSLGWIRQWLDLPAGMQFKTQTFATTTPIDRETVRLTLRHRVRKAPVGALTKVVLSNYARLFNATVEQDIVIWEKKIYRMRPIASKSDWAILKFRKWSKQFYDPTEYEAALRKETQESETELTTSG